MAMPTADRLLAPEMGREFAAKAFNGYMRNG
jgi:hypothetical protein